MLADIVVLVFGIHIGMVTDINSSQRCLAGFPNVFLKPGDQISDLVLPSLCVMFWVCFSAK